MKKEMYLVLGQWLGFWLLLHSLRPCHLPYLIELSALCFESYLVSLDGLAGLNYSLNLWSDNFFTCMFATVSSRRSLAFFALHLSVSQPVFSLLSINWILPWSVGIFPKAPLKWQLWLYRSADVVLLQWVKKFDNRKVSPFICEVWLQLCRA